jgi:asparagine synthase (glutamine-hydrolysing)
MYVRLVSQWHAEDGLLRAGQAAPAPGPHWPPGAPPLLAMRRWDAAQYLPDDILVKVDRASMSCSLESRAPLLDHRVVEFAFALPENALVRDGETKWLLRRLLYDYVPRNLIERPKSGFALPLADWLRGPLRDWAEALLDPKALEVQGMLNTQVVRDIWAAHLTRRADRSPHLWSVLMFQAWLRDSQAFAAREPRERATAFA